MLKFKKERVIFIMQVKKEEVKFAIMNEAEKEFYSEGFMNASVRKIVKAAGTTIGNFYNYFNSKEVLYEELVSEEYRKFLYFIKNHESIQRPDYLWDISDVSEWRIVLANLIQEIVPRFSDRFVLLVECSRGTNFENVRKTIIDLLKAHFIEHMERFSSTCKDTELAEIVAEQVLLGIISILKKYKDENVRKRLITEHFLYHFIGTMGLLGSWE